MTKTTDRPALKAVREALGATADYVSYSPKGECFIAKRMYFYRKQGGGSPEALADAIVAALPGAAVIETKDHFHSWPKDSWFEVRFTVRTIKELA